MQVCEGDRDEETDHLTNSHCEFAGDFFILGGANEMPWEYYLPYYFDVTEAVKHLGQPLDGHFYVEAEVFSVNGTSLGTDVLPRPYGSYRPPRGYTDRKYEEEKGNNQRLNAFSTEVYGARATCPTQALFCFSAQN